MLAKGRVSHADPTTSQAANFSKVVAHLLLGKQECQGGQLLGVGQGGSLNT